MSDGEHDFQWNGWTVCVNEEATVTYDTKTGQYEEDGGFSTTYDVMDSSEGYLTEDLSWEDTEKLYAILQRFVPQERSRRQRRDAEQFVKMALKEGEDD